MLKKISILCILLISPILAQNKKVLALADLYADYFFFTSSTEIEKWNLQKGGWQLYSQKDWNDFKNNFPYRLESRIGGSAMNVCKSLAHMGVACACIGRKGDDFQAKNLENQLKEIGIQSHLQTKSGSTGKVLCLISDEGQRTMLACNSEETKEPALSIDADLFKGIQILHIEGYQIPLDFPAVEKACIWAKKQGAMISLDLACEKIVQEHRKKFDHLLATYVDIVFSNEDEAKLFSEKSLDEACKTLGKMCSIAIVTHGKHGGWIHYNDKLCPFTAYATDVLDTTGAGDAFAGGFLFGLLEGYTPEVSAKIGAKIASFMIQQIGTDMSSQKWNECKQEVKTVQMQALMR
jgi:sugar/nucleoside kinase (ribokinase family)